GCGLCGKRHRVEAWIPNSSGTVARFDLEVIGAGLSAADLTGPLLAGDSALRTVVVAPPGTGKTTIVPPTVANRLASQGRSGKVVVTQPRRMAARAAARDRKSTRLN